MQLKVLGHLRVLEYNIRCGAPVSTHHLASTRYGPTTTTFDNTFLLLNFKPLSYYCSTTGKSAIALEDATVTASEPCVQLAVIRRLLL